ncbi:MAG: hypothetical protein Roseis2KO_07100 [Roseivirga sp.]
MKRLILLLGLGMCLTLFVNAQTKVKVDGRAIPYEQFSSFKLPGAQLAIEIQNKQGGEYRIFLAKELQSTFKTGTYTMTVPAESGVYPLQVMNPNDKVVLNLNLFVLTPIEQKKDEYLNGFRMGNYPPALGEGGKYERPRGFIEIKKGYKDVQLTPHFKLSQFVTSQKGNPKYIIIRESLLLKLEYILAEVNKAGVQVNTLGIRQAYLTPHDNAEKQFAIYSRFIYGDAAQIIIDRDKNGIMDDVNGDGVGDMRDARWLFNLIDKLSARADYQKLEGGLAHYRLNKKFGGYVYIDARGNKMRF